MNFSNIKSLTIPEGEVIKITSGGSVLWEKTSANLYEHSKSVTLTSENDEIRVDYIREIADSFNESDIYIEGGSGGDWVVTKIIGDYVYYYDPDEGEIVSTLKSTVNCICNGVFVSSTRPVGYAISIGTTPDQDQLYFDGTYNCCYGLIES